MLPCLVSLRGFLFFCFLASMMSTALGEELVVGNNTSGNTTNISSGTNPYSSTVVGNQAGASNNQLNVFNSGTVLTNTGNLTIGNAGSSNSLVISNQGSVVNSNGFVGYSSSNNNVLVTGTGSTWSNTDRLVVGLGGSGNRLVITNGASVVNSNTTIGWYAGSNSAVVKGLGSTWTNTGIMLVGENAGGNTLDVLDQGKLSSVGGVIGNGSSNNRIQVSGSNSVWSNSLGLTIGNGGSSNSLVISNEASVVNTVGNIGYTASASNNIVTVTGTNSAWTNSGDLNVGYAGSGNSMVISNQGSVVNSSGFIGLTSNSTNNSVFVTGTNSSWSNSSLLLIGYNGSSNSLVITNGGSVVNNSFGYIGYGSSNNIVTVTGTNSAWTNRRDLYVGYISSSNRMVISNGASVMVNSNGYIGTASPNNSVLVTGAGSAWTNTANLYIGASGSSNSLVISNGGRVVVNSNGYIGNGSGSSNNIVTVTGNGSAWTNLGNLFIGNGSNSGNTLTVTNGGAVSAANIYINSGSTLRAFGANSIRSSPLTLSGGTFEIGSYLEVESLIWNGGQIYMPTLTSSNNIYLNITNAATGLTATNSTNQFNVTGAMLTLNAPTKLLSATNMTTNNFSTNNFTVTGLTKYNLSISNSVLWLTSLFSSYTIYAATPNQYQVSSALNGFADATTGDRTTVTTALNSLTTDAQYQAAFEQMMPSIYSSLPTLAFNTVNALNTKLFERIWLMQVVGLSGAAVAGDSPTQNNDNNPLGLKADQNWSPFVDANGVFASANSGGTLDTYNAQNGGMTTGAMYKFLPNLMAGAYAGYQYTHAGYDGSTSMEDNAARFGLLASWAGETCYSNTDNIYLNGLVGGQIHNYNVDRQIVFSDINRTANATPTGGEFDSAVQVGYNIRESGFTFGPQASLQYTYLGVDSFNESGADSLDLNVNSFNSSSMMFTLGGQGAYRIEVDEDFAVIPMADASWQHECLQNPYGIQSVFNTGGPSESFNFQSSAPLRDFFYGGVGVGFAIGQNWQVSVLWNASAANADLASQNVFISAAARF
jgi:T5SS/PEP-CTERM-associated repeat protein